jgi:hypothetical protein
MAVDPRPRLVHLLDSIIDGSCSDELREEFSRLLDDHPELAQSVIDQLRTNGLLQWALSPSLSQAGVPPDPAPTTSVDGSQPSISHMSHGGNWTRWAAAAFTVLAASFACVAAFSWIASADVAVIGQVVDLVDVTLTANSTAIAADNQLTAGVLEIDSGRVAIEFINGVKMKVSGPARCEIDSDMLVRLFRGQATADVPRWARGFTIVTPDIEVVDLGTRFGVAKLEDVKTDVVVFEGEVDLKSLGSAEKQFARRLTQGEAARINRRGEIERIFQVHGEANDNDWSTFKRINPRGVIAAVWDNLGATKSVSYYQVIQRGMGEDMPAYVDHPHEWNGLTPNGLPDFLAAADYVRTVNDYRYMNALSIQVEFAADAELYVFFDNRVPAPDWLLAQFVDTGVDIGLDEDAWDGNPTFTVATGPGQSIDNEFSVYRRPCAAGETFVLGSMGAGREARAMYGLAATPR